MYYPQGFGVADPAILHLLHKPVVQAVEQNGSAGLRDKRASRDDVLGLTHNSRRPKIAPRTTASAGSKLPHIVAAKVLRLGHIVMRSAGGRQRGSKQITRTCGGWS